MKKAFFAVLAIAGVAVLLSQVTQTAPALSDFIPAGPLLYLEAKDFASLIKQWNGSAEKNTWLKSDNYQVFSRSRLFLRLGQAQQEFSAAAGFAPDMSLVNAAAGANSAIALYDIGTLEFLYITRMPTSRAYRTLLWQTRAKFQPRQSAGIDYYVRQEQRRLAAFAVTNDLLLVGTSEQALASALALIARQARPAMKQESWYQRTTAAQSDPGELRLVLNFDRVARTPYFRSYWVQRNTRVLAQFDAALCDLDHSQTEFRERRVMLRAKPGPDLRSSEAAVGEISRYVPEDAGLFRAWAQPGVPAALALIEEIAAPHPAVEIAQRSAPEAVDPDAISGSEQDLETRIDEAPVIDDRSKVDLEPARKLLESNALQSLLEVGTSQRAANGVFIHLHSAAALAGERPWDAASARAVFEALGAHATINGRILIVSNSEDLLKAMSNRAGSPSVIAGATYAMRFRHARELPNFERMMTLIDFPAMRTGTGDAREPLFFSENLASLGRTLGRIESVSLDSHDDGAAVRQTVVYKLQ